MGWGSVCARLVIRRRPGRNPIAAVALHRYDGVGAIQQGIIGASYHVSITKKGMIDDTKSKIQERDPSGLSQGDSICRDGLWQPPWVQTIQDGTNAARA